LIKIGEEVLVTRDRRRSGLRKEFFMADLPEEIPITDEDLKKQVLDNLDALDRRGKLRVLDFTSELTRREPSKVGATGGALLAFAGSIPKEDLDEMEKVIEEEFGRVDPDEW